MPFNSQIPTSDPRITRKLVEATVSKKQSILIVEPDTSILQSVVDDILRPSGFIALKAQSISEALLVITNKVPDLLVLHLPTETTVSFLSQLANIGQSVPTILVVESASTQIGVELLRLGVADYLSLSSLTEDMVRVIDSVLNREHPARNFAVDNCQTLKFEFADMASHLLRNPLNVIQTSVRCLQTLDLTVEDQQNLLGKIWEQSEKIKTFTHELLKNLRLETEGASVYPAPVALLPMIERVLSAIKSEKPDLVFHYKSDEPLLPPVAADAAKTEIILLNLLIGAIRRSFAGGTIAVSVQKNSSKIIVSVEDNGKPIPVKSLNEVFKPYYPVGSTGYSIPTTYQLGLYTTKRLVELQNGKIWAVGEPGKGTQFNFSLPIWEVKK